MTKFLTRKRDKQVYAIRSKVPRDSGSPSFVGVDKTQIEKNKFNLTDNIIAYETGELSEEKTIILFQHLVDTGMAWRLEGHYGRTAQSLLDANIIKYPRKHKKQSSTDFYGNKIPTHEQAKKLKLYKKDSDKDGVPDHRDCEPYNPNKQDLPKDMPKSRRMVKKISRFGHPKKPFYKYSFK